MSTNERLNKNDAAKRNNAATTLLDSVKLENAKKIASGIEAISFEFASVRNTILSYVANDTRLSLFKDNDVIKVLRVSKKDSELYRKLLMLSSFSYKRIKKDKDSFIIRKSYTVKAVLDVADFYNQTSKVELTPSLIEALKLEQELRSIEKVGKSVKRLQANVHVLQNTIESLTDAEANEALIKDYTEQLVKAESSLKNTIAMFDYINVKSNRDLIK